MADRCPKCLKRYAPSTMREHVKGAHLGTVCYFPGSTFPDLPSEDDEAMIDHLLQANEANGGTRNGNSFICRWTNCGRAANHPYKKLKSLSRHLKEVQFKTMEEANASAQNAAAAVTDEDTEEDESAAEDESAEDSEAEDAEHEELAVAGAQAAAISDDDPEPEANSLASAPVRSIPEGVYVWTKVQSHQDRLSSKMEALAAAVDCRDHTDLHFALAEQAASQSDQLRLAIMEVYAAVSNGQAVPQQGPWREILDRLVEVSSAVRLWEDDRVFRDVETKYASIEYKLEQLKLNPALEA
ncbi:hypothetical protein F4818DRAFT_454771 [Hypoxylon cercidicola]|nr:hypothetical protein F4818DRAFT_454771 [Hypoxylon cercidicola]